jgi:hypothetical protein
MKVPAQKNKTDLNFVSVVHHQIGVAQLVRVSGQNKLRIFPSKAAAIKAGVDRDQATKHFTELRGVTTQDVKCHIPVKGTDAQQNVTAKCEPSDSCDGECHVFIGDPGEDLVDKGVGPVRWPEGKICVCACVPRIQA